MRFNEFKPITEASGYIPSEAERNDQDFLGRYLLMYIQTP